LQSSWERRQAGFSEDSARSANPVKRCAESDRVFSPSISTSLLCLVCFPDLDRRRLTTGSLHAATGAQSFHEPMHWEGALSRLHTALDNLRADRGATAYLHPFLDCPRVPCTVSPPSHHHTSSLRNLSSPAALANDDSDHQLPLLHLHCLRCTCTRTHRTARTRTLR